MSTPRSISGNVSEGGGPLPDVIVEVADEDDNTVAPTTTDEDGNYVFSEIIPGEYTAVARPI